MSGFRYSAWDRQVFCVNYRWIKFLLYNGALLATVTVWVYGEQEEFQEGRNGHCILFLKGEDMLGAHKTTGARGSNNVRETVINHKLTWSISSLTRVQKSEKCILGEDATYLR